MKTSSRKRRVTKEVQVDKGTDKAFGSNVEETSLEKDGNTQQDDSFITEGKATSELSEQLAGDQIQIDEDAAMPKITGDEQKLNFPKEQRKRKRSADAEIVQAVLSSTDRCSSRLRPRKEVPSFQLLELNDNDIERIVGMRIKVYWPDSKRWFAGKIRSFNRGKMLHRINYDDGDVEELDLKKEKFKLEVKPSDGFHIKTELHSRKSKKDISDDVVAEEHDAEIEGESTKSAEQKGAVKSNLGKQQPADNKNQKDETQAGSVTDDVDESKNLVPPRNKRKC